MRRSLQKLLKLCRGGKKTMEKKIRLSDHFTYARLVRFVLPSIVMMIFTSIYGVVDGLFVSNFVGKTPFAALNLVMPVIMILGAVGFMIGTGGSALIAKVYGEGEEEKAKSYFTLMVIFTVLLGIVFTFVGMAVLRPLCILLKATDDMIDSCVLYGRIVIGFITFFMLQNVFQSFFITAGKPQIGLFVTLAAGFTNIALDALFVAGFKWGLAGAARDGHRTVHRRNRTVDLFRRTESEFASFYETDLADQTAFAGLRERVVGVNVEHFFFFGQYAV